MSDITTEQIVEASAKAMYERPPAPGITWERLDRDVRVEYQLDAQASLTAILPLIRKQLADEVRAYGDPMGGPDPGWLAGLETAARLIEEVER